MAGTANNVAASCGFAAALSAEALLEACPDAVVVTDAAWHAIAWNQRFTEFWRLATGTRAVWRQILLRLAAPRQVLAEFLEAPGLPYCAIARLKDGRWIEIRGSANDRSGIAGSSVWFFRDVTKRVLEERELRESVARSRRLADQSPDAIYLSRVGADGRFYTESFNRAAMIMNQSAEAEAGDRPLDEILPRWLASSVLDAHRQCRDTARPGRHELIGPPEAGGVVRDCILMPVCDDAGQVTRVILIGRDMTEFRRQREDLAQAAARAEAAERHAARAEARLVEAIETLPIAFMLFDRDEKLVLANSRCRDVYPVAADLLQQPGVSFEAMLRRDAPSEYGAISPAEIEARIAARLAEFRADTSSVERPLSNGRWLRIDDRRTPSGDTVSLRIDVTEGRVRERALADASIAWAERESQLRRIYANIPGVVYQLRMDPNLRARVDYISDRSVEFFGMTPAEVQRQSTPVFDFCHPDDRPQVGATLVAAFHARAPWECEFRIAVGGGTRWLRGAALPTALPDGVVLWDGVLVDVTATKSAEADALDARRRLEDAIESLSEGFSLYDREGHLVLSNSRQREMHAAFDPTFVFAPGTGFEAAIRNGAKASKLDDTEAFVSRRLEEFRAGKGAWEVQLVNGQWFQGTEQRMRDGGVVAVRRDITLLKRREEQLRAAMIEATAANKAKSEFLANMSHELRTPLNAIIGFSEMIESEIFGPLGNARYAGYVADILASGQHLLNIINAVLDLARVEAGKIVLNDRMIDIDSMIGDCATLVRDRGVRGLLRLKLEIEPALPVLRADPVRLKQVILNLLSNAMKFTKPHGQVTIRAGRDAEGGLEIVISDTGIGMDPRDIPHAFEPFGLVHPAHSRAHEGTGLGLPLSRALVEEHGGRLELSSALGIGTTATVTLPSSRFVQPVNPRDVASPS